MEDFIYILVGVIWLAATIYRASQKKKKTVSPPSASEGPEENQRVQTTEAILRDLLGAQEIKVPEPEVREARIPEPMIMEPEKPSRHIFQSEYARLGKIGLEALSGEGVRSLGGITFTNELKEEKESRKRPVEIDLRKAIIYKAILERPYI